MTPDDDDDGDLQGNDNDDDDDDDDDGDDDGVQENADDLLTNYRVRGNLATKLYLPFENVTKQ